MSDEQTKPKKPGQGGANVQERIRNLVQQVNDLTDLLRNQRQMLKERGMTLPTGSLDNLRALKTRMDGLSRQIINTQVELRQLRALAETTALINSELETDVVLNQVMDTVINLTGAERGYIVLKNKETGAFDEFQVARGLETSELSGHSDEPGKNEFIISKTIVNEVARSGLPILTDNASQDDRFQGQQSIVARHAGFDDSHGPATQSGNRPMRPGVCRSVLRPRLEDSPRGPQLPGVRASQRPASSVR